MLDLDVHEAEGIVESLRNGVPPTGQLRNFTVGRASQIKQLTHDLDDPDADPGVLLLQANYGAGKTHLLRLVREVALESNYAVALVTVDSKSNVRFNRMDQVVSAVMRSIEVPNRSGKGIGQLFDAFLMANEDELSDAVLDDRAAVSDDERWSMSRALDSQALWVALRAWHLSTDPEIRDYVSDYLTSSWDYRSQPGKVYRKLVGTLPRKVREPRDEKTMKRDGSFHWSEHDYQASWGALNDMQRLAEMSGFNGLVLLFDEFEDVIQNMNNIGYERRAFHNLLRLFERRSYSGAAYFAVTPEFSHRCQERLHEKEHFDFPTERFDELERVLMDPVTKKQFKTLAGTIRDVHAMAYDWDATEAFPKERLDAILKALYSRSSADQVRQAMVGLVAELDRSLDE
jgi:hypothetical protein